MEDYTNHINDTNKLLLALLFDDAPYDVVLEEENYVRITWSDGDGEYSHYGIASPPLICLIRREMQS